MAMESSPAKIRSPTGDNTTAPGVRDSLSRHSPSASREDDRKPERPQIDDIDDTDLMETGNQAIPTPDLHAGRCQQTMRPMLGAEDRATKASSSVYNATVTDSVATGAADYSDVPEFAEIENAFNATETTTATARPHHQPKSVIVNRPRRVIPRRLHLHRRKVEVTNSGPKDPHQIQTQFSRFILHIQVVTKGLWLMVSTFYYWDMAFWSGWSYSVGSALFVIDGAWAWTPIAFPKSKWLGEAEYGVPILFFVGALFFQVGALMAYLEAINDSSFAGAAMKRLLEGHDEQKKALLDETLHHFFGHIIPHHHNDSEEEIEEPQQDLDPETDWNGKDVVDFSIPAQEGGDMPSGRGGENLRPVDSGGVHEYLSWRWYPTWHALRTYHLYELGFIACSIQLLGVTLYAVTSVVGLPGILENLAEWQKLAAYWGPQVVASCLFLSASILFTLETQPRWYEPVPSKTNWWIGAWASIGSIGFLLSGCFGIKSNTVSWCEYQSSLSSTWGSAAYLTSSILQWYESVNQGPVLAFPNNRTPVLLRR